MVLKDQDEKRVYSDGMETEARMLKIAKDYPEDFSQDYIADNSEYIVNNTFSAVRRNILNWYPFKKEASVLEVGAGMGSLTGLLCDKAAHVTAIEMSETRANIIRARYPQRNNLTIISEDITKWKTTQKFDYVIFIGVLEYAGVFSDEDKPFHKFLSCAKNLLQEDGIILFAIENKYGLKYWVGGSEDHLQKPYAGLQGYKEPKTAKTFSRFELEEMLKDVGLDKYRVYSVYPDYKFPEMICTDEFEPSYMNLKKVNFTYSNHSKVVVDEKDIYKDLIENDVWKFFANSFLIEAGENHVSEPHVIHVSGKSEVKKQYRVSTVIFNDGRVLKAPMHEEAVKHIETIRQNNDLLKERGVKVLDMEQKDGILYSKFETKTSAQKLFVQYLKDNNEDEIKKLVQLLKKSLLKSSEVVSNTNIFLEANVELNPEEYGIILKDGFVDMTFYNAFVEENDIIFYDQEWRFDNVPLNFILYYALKCSYSRAQVETNITFEQLLVHIGITDAQAKAFEKLEIYIWGKILYRQTDFYGQGGYCRRYDKEISADYLEQQIERRMEQIAGELSDTKAELSYTQNEFEKSSQQCRIQKEQLTNMSQEICNRDGHIAQLLQKEREYNNLLNTKGVRVLQKWWRFKDWLLPPNSKRKALAKIAKKFVKHPIYMLKKCTPSRIARTLRYLRTENGTDIVNRLDAATLDAGNSGNIEKYELNLLPINENMTSLYGLEKVVLPKVDKPLVSIIIPVYNQFHYTYNCIRSIAAHTGDISYEVILADDCSTDLTKDIKDVVENIIVVKTPENMRFLRNCNHAAKIAKGEYIFFLNNDTQVLDGWLTSLLELMDRDEKIGMAGSKLLYPDGSLQEAGGILWRDGSAWNYGNQSSPVDSEYDYVKEVDYISGAAILIRKKLWDEIGGFDDRFAPAYCEDSDFAFEVRKHGYKVVYQPKSMVVHFEGISNGTDISSGQKEYQIVNTKKFYEKWKSELKENHFRNAEHVFLARERSKNKKHVLVIDHYVPQYDKDAGSKTTFMYLKMLVGKGYQITFLGDNFYRHEPYTTELQQMGIFVLYGPKYANNWKQWLDQNLQYFDIVYLNRPHISIKYIDFIKKRAKGKIVYYGHDLHFLRMQREAELNHDDKLTKKAEEWKEQELYLMRQADMSYYPSSIETDAIHKIDADIKVKPITAYVYEQFREVRYEPSDRNGLLFVGGFGHGPNIDAVLWFLDKIYPEVYKRTKAPFYVVGSKAPKEITNITTEGVIVKGFVSEEELQKLYDTCKIVVVPLRYGAGVKGKVVEALYYGTPIVTTSVGAEGIDGIEDVAEIFDSENKLIDGICDLYENGEKLKTMSEKSQKFVRTKFSIDAVWNTVKEEFE